MISKKTQSDSSQSKPLKATGARLSMEQLLASQVGKIPVLKRGQEIMGRVVMVSPQEILVDVGGKSEGLIAGKELSSVREIASKIDVGDQIEVTVLYPENDAGQVVLTLRKFTGEKRWGELEERKKDGDEIEVGAVEANRGGIICEFAGLRGFLPASQLASAPSRLESLIGKNLKVRVIEVDRQTNRLIFSQKAPGKKDLAGLIKLLSKVKIGDKYAGVVTAVLPFGVFVEIEVSNVLKVSKVSQVLQAKKDGEETSDTPGSSDIPKLEGLVHISEISWEKIDDPLKIFKVGDEVGVVVITKDMTTGRLNLSIKQLTEDPFVTAAEKYSKEQKVSGTIVRVTPYGVFVALEEGIEGLIHVSKIPPNANWQSGQEIECEIESVDAAARKIVLVPIVLEKPILYR